MKAASSLVYVRNVITELYNALLQTLDEVEVKIGINKKLRTLILALKV